MGDRDRAAELLHQALGVAPTHEEALARYVDHFRERRDWRGLDRALRVRARQRARRRRRRRRPRAPARGDRAARRAPARRHPARDRGVANASRSSSRGSPKVAEALRRLTSRGKMWEQLVQSLETEVASAGDPIDARCSRSRRWRRRIASASSSRVARSSSTSRSSPRTPSDEATLKALAELYEKRGRRCRPRADAAPPARLRGPEARRADDAGRAPRRRAAASGPSRSVRSA